MPALRRALIALALMVYAGIGMAVVLPAISREAVRCGRAHARASDALAVLVWPAVITAVAILHVTGEEIAEQPCEARR